ncbi:MAG TPA: hypothetical protein VIG72_06515 [Pontibacter sp.]
MKTPGEDDIITNSDESKRLPDENPEPLEGVKKDELEIKQPTTEKSSGHKSDEKASPDEKIVNKPATDKKGTNKPENQPPL